MKIQSLSIVVPTKRCVNNCKFCVSKMHDTDYKSNFNEMDYMKRIKYAAMNGVTSLILTGTGEPLQNTRFIGFLSGILKKLDHPIPNIELQTTGVFLNGSREYIHPDNGQPVTVYPNIELLKKLGVNTISLSVSNIFNSDDNINTIGIPKPLQFNLNERCNFIKNQGFNLRLSLNMTNAYDNVTPENIIHKCKEMGGDQITIRKLYESGNDSPEDKWVRENQMDWMKFGDVFKYILDNGKKLYKLPSGGNVYSIDGMSIAVDLNCMSKGIINQFNEDYYAADLVQIRDNTDLKYVIIRENGKLYCQWDDEGSLIF